MNPEPLAYVDDQAINIRDMSDLTARVGATLAAGKGFTLYTLNLDHLVKRRQNAAFRALYARATFVSADGWPIVALARRDGSSIELTTGSDSLVPLCRMAAKQNVSVALLGSTKAVLAKAAVRLRQLCPGLDVALCIAPDFGFDPLGVDARETADWIAASGACLCFVALGAPKQELFSDQAFVACPTVGFVCIGAALDFIAGTQTRAPSILQSLRAEWLWRLLSAPRRLGGRYFRCALLFVRLILQTKPSPGLMGPKASA